MATEAPTTTTRSSKKTLKDLSQDSWLLVSHFLTYNDIVNMSVVNQEFDSCFVKDPVWQYQCIKIFGCTKENAPLKNQSWKSIFEHYVNLYTIECIPIFRRVLRCYRLLRIWAEECFPSLLNTFNPPATKETIEKFKSYWQDSIIKSTTNNDNNNNKNNSNNNNNNNNSKIKYPVSYMIFMGECMNGQNTGLGLETGTEYFGLFGTFKSYHYRNSSHLSSIEDSMRISGILIENGVCNMGYHFFAGGFSTEFIPKNSTYIRQSDLKIVKFGLNNKSDIFDQLSNNENFLILMEYYITQLIHSNYRLSLPLSDIKLIEQKKLEKLKQLQKNNNNTGNNNSDNNNSNNNNNGNNDGGYDSDNADTRTQDEKEIEASAYASNPSLYEETAYGILRFCINQFKNVKTGIVNSTAVHKHSDEYGNIIIRGCPIFIPELSQLPNKDKKESSSSLSTNNRHASNKVVFAYHIEIECPSTKTCKNHKILDACPTGQLKTRIWIIYDNNNKEEFEGPGVIGLYPRIGVNQPLFSYESMSHQTNPYDGKMGGFFTFELHKTKEIWKATVPFYTLDIRTTEWI